MNARLSRRQFFRSTLVAGGVGATGLALFSTLYASYGFIRRQLYSDDPFFSLTGFPAHQIVGTPFQIACQRAATESRSEATSSIDAQAIKNSVKDFVQRDLETGRFLPVDDWYLAESETRLIGGQL